MINLVLIHGAWHNASCWTNVLKKLSLNVHVVTPDLPGHGHFAMSYQQIHIEDYITHITNIILSLSGPVYLLGHSFAGIVISEIASRIPERIKKLIYINAYIPMPGDSLLSLSAKLQSNHLTPYLKINTTDYSIDIYPRAKLTEFMYQCSHHANQYIDNIQTEPLLPFHEPVLLSSKFQDIPKLALMTRQDLSLCPSDQIHMCERQAIPYQIIDGDHCFFIEQPELLVDFLASTLEEHHAQ